jgi:hypothetical protein
LIFLTENPWINSKFISVASPKLLLAHLAQDLFFNLQEILFKQPRHHLQPTMVAALLPPPSVWAAKSLPEPYPLLSLPSIEPTSRILSSLFIFET